MTLPLPYVLGEEDDPIQGNFDELKRQFPLSRRHMQIETPHVVGAVDEPAFQNSWVNFGAPHQDARFWKDPMGTVHIEGLLKSGTNSTAAFTLPEGYRPGATLTFAVASNVSTHGSVQVEADGDVILGSGSTVSYSINVSFKQEN